MVIIVSMMRYILLSTSQTPELSVYLGDTFSSLGSVFRIVFYLSIIAEGFLAFGFNLITQYFGRHSLIFLCDLKTLEKLSAQNYRRIKLILDATKFLMPKLLVSTITMFTNLCLFGIYQNYKTPVGVSPLSGVYYIPAIIISYLSVRYIASVFFLMIPLISISTYYLSVRYDQINWTLSEVLEAKFLDQNVIKLNNYINVYNELTCKVHKYNSVMKYYLLITHYTLSASLAIIIFELISGNHSLYVNIFLTLNTFGNILWIMLLYGSASMINTSASKSFNTLDTIYIAYNKYFLEFASE